LIRPDDDDDDLDDLVFEYYLMERPYEFKRVWVIAGHSDMREARKVGEVQGGFIHVVQVGET
jgi:hypothetical protein